MNKCITMCHKFSEVKIAIKFPSTRMPKKYRKKKKEKDLYSYFAVVEKNKKPIQKNFQGFPLQCCKYEEEIKEYVFCPVGMAWDPNSELCRECCFRPCIPSQKWDDIASCCEEALSGPFDCLSEEKKNEKKKNQNSNSESVQEMYVEALTFVEDRVLAPVFGRTYVDSNLPPSCVLGHVTEYYETVANDLSQD